MIFTSDTQVSKGRRLVARLIAPKRPQQWGFFAGKN